MSFRKAAGPQIGRLVCRAGRSSTCAGIDSTEFKTAGPDIPRAFRLYTNLQIGYGSDLVQSARKANRPFDSADSLEIATP